MVTAGGCWRIGIILLGISLVGCGPAKPDLSESQTVNDADTAEVATKTEVTTQRQENNLSAPIFSPEDTEVLGISLDMEKEQLEAVLGAPERIESHYEDAFGGEVLNYFYEFGRVRLEPFDVNGCIVSAIVIDQPDFNGPRGIQVNEDITAVLNKFPYRKGSPIEDGMEYIYGKEEENSGYITYENETITALTYNYGGGGFGSYTLRMEISDHKIKSILINVINI